MTVRTRMVATIALVVFALVASGISGSWWARPYDRSLVRTELVGESVRGRPIRIVERGDPDPAHRILVVGNIHGNEPAGISIAERLESMPLPAETDLWLIDTSNPDGVAAHTRTNADGVDLNRNFPWHGSGSGGPVTGTTRARARSRNPSRSSSRC